VILAPSGRRNVGCCVARSTFARPRPTGATECSQGWSGAEPLVASPRPNPRPEGGGGFAELRDHRLPAVAEVESSVTTKSKDFGTPSDNESFSELRK